MLASAMRLPPFISQTQILYRQKRWIYHCLESSHFRHSLSWSTCILTFLQSRGHPCSWLFLHPYAAVCPVYRYSLYLLSDGQYCDWRNIICVYATFVCRHSQIPRCVEIFRICLPDRSVLVLTWNIPDRQDRMSILDETIRFAPVVHQGISDIPSQRCHRLHRYCFQ